MNPKNLKLVTDISDLSGKTVLVRADYNVQIVRGDIVDPQRITRTFETIDYLRKEGAKIVLMSHLGRPKGKKNRTDSLRPVADFLSDHFDNVKFVTDCQGDSVRRKVARLKRGDILLLENLRFYPYEENDDAMFAKKLAKLGDYYVNDAFGVSHRKHASVHAITEYIDSYAGLNVFSEIENINRVLSGFKKPALAILGGVKISTKIRVIEKFLDRFAYVLIGGALANNFLVNKGLPIGKSVYENDHLKTSKKFLEKYSDRIILPVDFVLSDSLKEKKNIRTVNIDDLKSEKNGYYIVDIGPKTRKLFKEYIDKSQTLVWNGPLGLFEIPDFAKGTKAIARAFANHAAQKPYGIAGGGETIAVINNLKLGKMIDFVSTGGGAMLTYIEKETLPALKKLYKTR